MRLFDAHTHLGQFHDCYYNPQTYINICKIVGITDVAVSSCTTVDEDYDKILSEISALLAQDEVKIYPVLWITPKMLRTKAIDKFLSSGIDWRCVKVHNYQQHGEWGDSLSPLMRQATDLARHLDVPLLFHCGNELCMPDDYEPLIAAIPDVRFVIAHSRPVDQTIRLLTKYPNAFADTAFTPTKDILRMFDASLSNKVMWGTDIPIMSYYYNHLNGQDIADFDYKQYCDKYLSALKVALSYEDYMALTYDNASRLYR